MPPDHCSVLQLCADVRECNVVTVCVSEWRCDEEQRINSSLRGAERKAALCSLLEQEAQLIADIGRHQITVQQNNYDKTVRNFLDKVRVI